MALIAGGASAIGGLPDIIPSKYEREQKKKLAEMKRQQEMGALGLSDTERTQISNQFSTLQAQAQERGDAMRQSAAGIQGQPGQVALQNQLAQEASQGVAAQQAQQVTQMDMNKTAQQEQDIIDLEAAQAEYAMKRREALVAPISSGAEAYIGGMATEAMIGAGGADAMKYGQAGQASQKQTQAAMRKQIARTKMIAEYGFTDAEFEKFYDGAGFAGLDTVSQSYWNKI